MAQPLLINLPSLRVLALRGAGGWAMAGFWPLVHEARHFFAAEFKNMSLPFSAQCMQNLIQGPPGQSLCQLNISVCSSSSVDIEGYTNPRGMYESHTIAGQMLDGSGPTHAEHVSCVSSPCRGCMLHMHGFELQHESGMSRAW